MPGGEGAGGATRAEGMLQAQREAGGPPTRGQQRRPERQAQVPEDGGNDGGVAVGITPLGALLLQIEGTGESREGLEERVRAAVVAATGIRPHSVVLLAPGTLPRASSGRLRRPEALRRHLLGTLHAPVQLGPVRLEAELARSAWGMFRASEGSEDRSG